MLKKSINAKAPLYIKGKDATITCSGSYGTGDIVRKTSHHNVYQLKSSLSLFSLFYDQSETILKVSESVLDSGVNYVEGDIQSSDGYGAGASLKIPISSNLSHLKNKTFPMAYGYFDCGWGTVNFRLDRSDGRFFYCTTLNVCSTNNYQYDRKAYKKPVRFVIYNAELKENAIYFDDDWLYVPRNIDRFHYLCNRDSEHKVPRITTASDLVLDNVRLVGFSGIVVNSDNDRKCEIKDCLFKNCLGFALKITKQNGEGVRKANVTKCTFRDCAVYSDFIVMLSSTYDKRTCITLSDCSLSRYPESRLIYKNVKPTVSVTGDAEIIDNIFFNSCRGHLGLNSGSIVVRGNFLYNSDDFYTSADRNMSSDWGLIYCNHIYKETDKALDNTAHHILLENNLLYGAYAYGGDARGIFIDDGRGDVECRNNVILNTELYSIDSRNAKLHDASSVRNRLAGNMVSSGYRLAGGPAVKGEDVPTSRGNILLGSQPNRISNARILDKDVSVGKVDESCSSRGDKIVVSKDLFELMKKSPAWQSVRLHVERQP